VNDKTLEAVEGALETVRRSGLQHVQDEEAKSKRGLILARAQSAERLDLSTLEEIASELSVPLAVVEAVIGASPAETPRQAQGGAVSRRAEPDWSFQDVAYKRCRFALDRKGPGRKVGLIIPTGGGKTRVALRIVLGELHDAQNPESTVLWITHRKRLATQAKRELQKMVTKGTPELPEDAVALLANRVRFVLTTDLETELTRAENLEMLVVDEAHHAAAPSYQPIFAARPALPALFLTATPRRRDERHIGIDEVAYSITYRKLIESGAVVEPSFEPPYVLAPDAWEDPEGLDDFAEDLLDRAEGEFVKTLVVATTIERVRALAAALGRALAARRGHILGADDIGWVHGNDSSTGADPEGFLDEFASKDRGILVATSSLLSEGYDDPRINAAVITYPSTSLVQLMQTAGRALRYSPGKRQAFIVQVKESELAYHFEQRWLYREISDVLHPQLEDRDYRSKDDLRRQVEELLGQRNVRDADVDAILKQLDGVVEGESCSVLLTGFPYHGSAERFTMDAQWNAVLDAGSESELFREMFNEFSEGDPLERDIDSFLKTFMSPDPTTGSEWRRRANMLMAMGYARRELAGTPYDGRQRRPYIPSRGTTWLTYITFNYHPDVPQELRDFLRPCVNAEGVLAEYSAHPEQWVRAVRVPLPLGGAFGWMLGEEQAAAFDLSAAELSERLRAARPDQAFSVVGGWLAEIAPTTLPMALLQRFERFLNPDTRNQDVLELRVDHSVDPRSAPSAKVDAAVELDLPAPQP
jgi:superfamily II DNA or RNA helicase